MPRIAAALLTFLFIGYLLYVDRKRPAGVSRAVWLPFLWIFQASSYSISGWMHLGASGDASTSYLEGSPLDRMIFLGLLALALAVLAGRTIDWNHVVKRNSVVFLYFLFGAVSILWSDYPSVSTKRIIKSFGNVVMAIVILTEDDPRAAISLVLRRMAFILIPLSFLFIKYYPEFGRAYHMGKATYRGATSQKNSLGQVCLFTGLYFIWNLLINDDENRRIGTRGYESEIVHITMIALIFWNLVKSQSATSLLTLIIGTGILILARFPWVAAKSDRVMNVILGTALAFGILEIVFGVSGFVIELMGRDSTLTTRVPIWLSLIELSENRLLGAGFESYWVGERLQYLWQHFGMINNAHNGYLETYLNVGLVGLGIMVAYILIGLRHVRRRLTSERTFGVLSLTLTVVIVVYNWTEATFYTVSTAWVLLLISIIEVHRPMSAPVRASNLGGQSGSVPRPDPTKGGSHASIRSHHPGA